MKSSPIVSALMAMFLTLSGPTFAQGDGDVEAQQRNKRALDELANRRQGQRGYERGAGPDHQLRRGDRLPPEYRHRNYVVDDWRGHNLSAPPRGYQWVQTGADYVLVAIATGIILQLLLGNN